MYVYVHIYIHTYHCSTNTRNSHSDHLFSMNPSLESIILSFFSFILSLRCLIGVYFPNRSKHHSLATMNFIRQC